MERGCGPSKKEEGQRELVHKSVNKVEEMKMGKMGKRSRDPLSDLCPDGANKGLDPSGGFEEDEEEDEEPNGRKRKRMDMESDSSTSAGKVEEESSIEEDDGSGMDDLALLLAGDD